MSHVVRVNAGFKQIALPDGQVYDGGVSGVNVVLTNEQYAKLAPNALVAILTDMGEVSDTVIESPDGTHYRVVVGDDGTLSTEEV